MIVQRAGAKRLFLPDMGISVVEPMGGAAPGNGLLNNLIAYWPGNEAAGDALDLHVNALHLTDVNTVTSNPGLVYPLARQYTRANNEYHTRASEALLQTGDVDFTFAQWLYLDSKPGGSMRSIGKDAPGAGNREYLLSWSQAADQMQFAVFRPVDNAVSVAAGTLGAPAITTWYLVLVWHDSVANSISISINNGGVDSAATGGALQAAGASNFRIGTFDRNLADSWDGRIDPTMFWKSAAGAGGVLTAAQRTALWNGGAGLTYAAFTA